jgi:hypothetical protein
MELNQTYMNDYTTLMVRITERVRVRL